MESLEYVIYSLVAILVEKLESLCIMHYQIFTSGSALYKDILLVGKVIGGL